MMQQKFTEKLIESLRWRLLKPSLPKVENTNLKFQRLGSKYGGKTIIDCLDSNSQATVISAGAGEDVSFEIEIVSKYNVQLYLLDPTPQAINHFQELKDSPPVDRRKSYVSGSRQEPNNYNLSRINWERIIYIPKALWKHSGAHKLYLPIDGSRDSSASLLAIHSHYRKHDNVLVVETISFTELVEMYNLQKINVLKLDVEGAALVCLQSVFKSQSIPDQISLDFDEAHFPSLRSMFVVSKLKKLLRHSGFICVHREGMDFLFLQKDLLASLNTQKPF